MNGGNQYSVAYLLSNLVNGGNESPMACFLWNLSNIAAIQSTYYFIVINFIIHENICYHSFQNYLENNADGGNQFSVAYLLPNLINGGNESSMACFLPNLFNFAAVHQPAVYNFQFLYSWRNLLS